MIKAINLKTGKIISGASLVFNSAGALLPAFVLEPIAEKFGRVKTQMGSLAIMAVGYLLIAFWGDGEYSLYILMGIVGIGWVVIVSLPFAIMSEVVDKERMGFFMGMFNLSIVIPQLLVSLIVGTIVQNSADKNIVFIISSVSLALSALIWMIIKEKK